MDDKWQLLSEILTFSYCCADCGFSKNIDYWFIINKCTLICQECADIHLSLGYHVSLVKCLTYPPPHSFDLNEIDNEYRFFWTYLELKLLKYSLENAIHINNLWHKEDLDHNVITPLSKVSPLCNNQSTLNRHSWDTSCLISDTKDKAVQIDLGSLSTITKSISNDTIEKSSSQYFPTKIYRESIFSTESYTNDNINFSFNPVYNPPKYQHSNYSNLTAKPKPTSSFEIKSNYVRAKYLQLLHFNHDFREIASESDPKLKYDKLNVELAKTVVSDNIKQTLSLLCLGADPNVLLRNNNKRDCICPIDIALSAGQCLQAFVLTLWGGSIMLDSNNNKFYKLINAEIKYKITDTLYQFCLIPLNTQHDNAKEGKKLVDIDLEDYRHESLYDCVRKNFTKFNQGQIISWGQDLYEDVLRRDLNNLMKVVVSETDLDNYTVAMLPINPLLDHRRNIIRHKLSRLPEPIIKLLCFTLLEYLTNQNYDYGQRYEKVCGLTKVDTITCTIQTSNLDCDGNLTYQKFVETIEKLNDRLTKLESRLGQTQDYNGENANGRSKYKDALEELEKKFCTYKLRNDLNMSRMYKILSNLVRERNDLQMPPTLNGKSDTVQNGASDYECEICDSGELPETLNIYVITFLTKQLVAVYNGCCKKDLNSSESYLEEIYKRVEDMVNFSHHVLGRHHASLESPSSSPVKFVEIFALITSKIAELKRLLNDHNNLTLTEPSSVFILINDIAQSLKLLHS